MLPAGGIQGHKQVTVKVLRGTCHESHDVTTDRAFSKWLPKACTKRFFRRHRGISRDAKCRIDGKEHEQSTWDL